MKRDAGLLWVGFFVLVFFGSMLHEAVAQDIDAKIKKLEEIEARLDAKLKKLEEVEARLDMRLESAAARSSGVVAETGGDGKGGMSRGVPSASAAGGAAARSAEGRTVGEPDRELLSGQVTWRTGFTHFDRPVRSGAFTGSRNGSSGYMFGSTFEVPFGKDGVFNTWLGYTSIDYIRTSGETTFAVTGDRGKQSFFRVVAAPKYRIDTLGSIRPYIIPIGLSILVNSPPSQSATYLSVGGSTGVGAEWVLTRYLTLGLGFSYNFYNSKVNHLSLQPYVGVNF